MSEAENKKASVYENALLIVLLAVFLAPLLIILWRSALMQYCY